MKLEELMKQKAELEMQMKNLDKQIDKCKSYNSVACCETIIKAFEELDDLLPYENLLLETYCEECESDRDIRIDFDEIIVAMKDLKIELEKRVKREEI